MFLARLAVAFAGGTVAVALAGVVVYFLSLKSERRAKREALRPEGPVPSAPKAKIQDCASRFLIVVDFECTCTRDTTFHRKAPWPHEIIEFPAVLIDLADPTADPWAQPTFHRFVRPTERSKLTPFCTSLTGIDQATVDAAETLDVILPVFWRWVESVTCGAPFAFAADGPWDLRRFLLGESVRKRLPVDDRATTWVDVSLHLRKFYDVKKPGNLEAKLQLLGMAFRGRPHSGLDDARNIARLAVRLFADGCALTLNDGWGADRVTPRSRTDKEKRAAKDRARTARPSRQAPILVDW